MSFLVPFFRGEGRGGEKTCPLSFFPIGERITSHRNSRQRDLLGAVQSCSELLRAARSGSELLGAAQGPANQLACMSSPARYSPAHCNHGDGLSSRVTVLTITPELLSVT